MRRVSFADHPDPQLFETFSRGDASRDEARQILLHLLAGCSRCQELARAYGPVPGPTADERPAYGGSFEHLLAGVAAQQERLGRERKNAPRLVEELLSVSASELEMLIEEDARYRSWGVVEDLLRRSRELGSRSAAEAVDLAKIAERVTARLDGDAYGECRLHDLRGWVHAELGNALKHQSEFRQAEREIHLARHHLEKGTGDPSLRAMLLLQEASFYGSQGRYEESFAALNSVVAIARRLDDEHLEGRALITRALFEEYADPTDETLKTLERGLRLIDPTREARLMVVGWHNVVLALTNRSRYQEARERLGEIHSLHERYGNRLWLTRLRWIEARIDLGEGHEDRAEGTFKEVRREFVDEGIGMDAALVSLDLAGLYARQSRIDEVRELAQQMLPIFKSRDVHREAIAALIVFQKAAEMDQVTVGLVNDIVRYLNRARNNPQLRFEADR